MNNGPTNNNSRYRNPDKKLRYESMKPFIFNFLADRAKKPINPRKKVRKVIEEASSTSVSDIHTSKLQSPEALDNDASVGHKHSNESLKAILPVQNETVADSTASLSSAPLSLETHHKSSTDDIDAKRPVLQPLEFDPNDISGINVAFLDEFIDMEKLISDLKKERDYWRENYFKVYNETQVLLAQIGGTVSYTTIYQQVTEINSPPIPKSVSISPEKPPKQSKSDSSSSKLSPRRLQYF